MGPLTISLASRPYDGLLPILYGEVSAPGLQVDARLDYNVPRIFGALFKGEVDAGEMSLAELIYYTSRGRADFVAVPVFPSRIFRHGFFFCRPEAGIRGPGDLSGRRIGFQRWVQTAGVWMRGILTDDYGVSARETQWFVGAMHHWQDELEEDVRPNDGSVIRRYSTASMPEAEDASQAILHGEVDVVGVTEAQAPALVASGKVRRLFEDYRAEEMAYFRRTRILPIMHVLAVRRSLAEERPELPAELFRLFSRSKRTAQRAASALPSWSLAWRDHYLEQERGVFGGDLWPFGLAANRHVLETFLDYCWRQGIASRRLAAEELFAPSTRDLVED